MLNVHRFGPDEGPAILCLHGVTGHGQRFRRLAGECLASRRVLAPDLRGHGRSTWLPPWTAEQHVLDLVDLLEAEELETIDIVGHSFGGLIATHLASAIGEHVGRVVLLDPAIELEPEHALGEAEAARNPPSWASPEDAKAARREQRTPAGYAASDQDVDDHLERGEDGRYRFRYCASAAVTAWSEMAGPVVDLREFAGRIHCVTAGQAPYVRDSTREWLQGDLGDRFTETVIDAGHMLYWDAYDETAAEVAASLS
jgi:lipase